MTVFTRWPVDNPVITQPFGNVNTWEAQPHAGCDIGMPLGTPIYAPCDAFVVWATGQPFGYGNTWEMIPGNPNSGNCIILQPPAPHTAFQTSLSHCQDIYVKAGDWVTAGQLIGTVGSTGNSTGPHIHWEAFIDYAEGVYPPGTFYGRVDPLEYFNTVTVVPISTGGKGSAPVSDPTPMEGFLMALTDKQQQEIYDVLVGKSQTKFFERAADVVLGRTFKRTLDGKLTSLKQEASWLPSNFEGIKAFIKGGK